MRGGDSFTRALGRLKCPKCGGTNTRIGVGTAKDLVRFEGMKYKVCGACGHEEPQAGRRPRREL
jgi:hypothetical protein